ncbi:hypothetical protein KIW84_030371 [Lathyrus oleraceus]|uniref:Retroviral polymerase SH3-like domain-containing protein n=1 Tax=Pisum sativum TaxID=3888 RepID=A0A9D4XSV2_PEA|nr:hypothetical protein KIW84_030371 [Pisum sativum]
MNDKRLCFVLLGVSEVSKAYRLYDPIPQKIITSKDVVFEEHQGWDWDNKYEEAISCDLDWVDKNVEVNAEEENDVGNEFDHITDTKEEENVSSNSRTEENTSNPNQQSW